jgi:hypothetical protein
MVSDTISTAFTAGVPKSISRIRPMTIHSLS